MGQGADLLGGATQEIARRLSSATALEQVNEASRAIEGAARGAGDAIGPVSDHWGTQMLLSAAKGVAGGGAAAFPEAAAKALGAALSQAQDATLSADAARLSADSSAVLQDVRAALGGALRSASSIAADSATVASDSGSLLRDTARAAAAPLEAAAAPVLDALAALGAGVSGALLDPAAVTASSGPLVASGSVQGPAVAALVAGATVASVLSLLSWDRAAGPRPGAFDVDPELPRQYDVARLRDYYSRRPVELVKRTLETAWWAVGAGLGILADRRTGAEARNEATRARQVREACERLGPAFIKVAQAISTRGDILSEAYMAEVIKLQDEVKPFPTAEAVEIMREDFGRDPTAIFAEITPEPVAAASLGQVYKARLRDELGGGVVAVKVQRPRVLETVALDLFIIREAARMAYAVAPEPKTDLSPVLDEWAVRFFEEMDYTTEMANALRFAEDMKDLEGIKVPRQYPELTARRVLVTEWVDGEKLISSSAADVRELCDTLLNCYLVQLLDSGFLHADPHPGNLLRTPDGKICILDYGLMTEVGQDKRYAFLEYIGHLTTANWKGVATDLVNLGFAPEGYTSLVEVEGFLELIEQVLSILVSGGGAQKVQEKARSMNIGSVLEELEEMSKEYKFTIPPYFALILRSFSVIEGIALRVDPDYAIVQECFPYLSRRLLADDSPRMKAALRELLYADGQRIDLARFRKLADGFNQYTVAGIAPSPGAAAPSAAAPRPGGAPAPLLDRNAVDAVKLVFRREGSFIADLLVDELAATVNALSREAALELSRLVLQSAAVAGSRGAVQALGPLRPFVAPFPLPSEVLSSLLPAVKLSEDDRVAINNVRLLWSELEGRLPSAPGQVPDAAALQSFVRALDEARVLWPDVAPGLARANSRLVSDLVRRTAERLAEDLGEARFQGVA